MMTLPFTVCCVVLATFSLAVSWPQGTRPVSLITVTRRRVVDDAGPVVPRELEAYVLVRPGP